MGEEVGEGGLEYQVRATEETENQGVWPLESLSC